MDLQIELNTNLKLLQESLESLKKTGRTYATAERDYKIKLRQEVLKLRDEGQAIGVITLICYGIPEIARARYERDVAKVIYEANQEAINTYKLKIKLIESQIGREWVNDSRG